MALSEEFKEAVGQDKVTRVRIMLKDSLLLDPSCKEFDEMLNYAKNNMDSIVDKHDGEHLKSSDSWDEDYFNDEMVAVVSNFSMERIELLKAMVKKLYSRNDETSQVREAHAANGKSEKQSVSGLQTAGGCVAVVGAGMLIGGIVAEVPVAIPIGSAAIGAGVYMILKK